MADLGVKIAKRVIITNKCLHPDAKGNWSSQWTWNTWDPAFFYFCEHDNINERINEHKF